MAEGPAAGLAITDQLADAPALRNYHLLSTVRGDLLERLGRHDEAQAAFEAAARLAANTRERDMLKRRAATARNMANQS
jgi:predicted RNA polymerase sigma factor